MDEIKNGNIEICPLISIITVCLNNEKELEETFKSVVNQTYGNIEYIIIDGGSTDNTRDIIKKYENKIDYWSSEPDRGIYDAMNKGVNVARGKWINFMNAGDKFYSRNTIEQIFSKSFEGIDFVYGDCVITYGSEFSRFQKAGDIKDLWKGMVFSHQSMFTKRDVFKTYHFSVKNRIGADFEFLYRCFMNKYRFYNTNIPIAKVSSGGVSDTNRIESILARKSVIDQFSKSPKINLYYCMLLVEAKIKSAIKKILPDKINLLLLKKKYKNKQRDEDCFL